MKRCPICGAHAVEEAGTCFECLYHFDTLSTEDVCRLDGPDISAPADVGRADPGVSLVEAEGESGQCVGRADPGAPPAPAPLPFLVPEPSEARSFSIELRFGVTAPHCIKTHKGSLYIGRAVFNDLVIDDECIMRRHAHLYRLEQGVFMELLTPGTTAMVNGQMTTHISLVRDEDVISLGPCDAIVHC